jgi:hypothetical protein
MFGYEVMDELLAEAHFSARQIFDLFRSSPPPDDDTRRRFERYMQEDRFWSA